MSKRTDILGAFYDQCQAAFKRSPKARRYLDGRGLDPAELDCGYCPPNGVRVSDPESAQKLGLITQNGHAPSTGSGQAFFRNCIVFPMYNQKGEVVHLYGRSLSEQDLRHFFLKGKRRGLWPPRKDGAGTWPDEQTKRIILTEGMIDAATLLQYTEETVLALYSTSGFGQDQLTAIQGLPELEEVVFFLDGDEAGRKAVEQHSKLLHELLPASRSAPWPRPMTRI